MSDKILDKAFAGKWITLEEIRAFGEDYQKEFGRVKNGLIGAGLGGAAGAGAGALGVAAGGDPEFGLIGAAIGSAAGATGFALLRKYLIVYLNKDGQVNGEMKYAVNKKGACEKIKEKVPRCSHVKAFKCPEEDELARDYSNELRRGKKLIDKLLK